MPVLWLFPAGFYRNYQWSADNSAEVAKGWIIEGQTIGELAEMALHG